jgi:outer membrane protein OmpA-like peptidoglycan-associated protein
VRGALVSRGVDPLRLVIGAPVVEATGEETHRHVAFVILRASGEDWPGGEPPESQRCDPRPAPCADVPACGASQPTARVEETPADADLDSVADARDACPESPEDRDEFEDDDGCPDPDNDADRIADIDDLCPCNVEDADGFEDADGCPDPDDDQDRILDVCDRCPREAEVYNGHCDEDGCPDRGMVLLVEEGIQVLDRVGFARSSARLGDDAAPLLDAVATTIVHNPQIEVIAVIGHAARGEREREALARARAEAVQAALLLRGLDPERVVVEISLDPEAPGDALRGRAVGFEVRRMDGRAYRDGRPIDDGPAVGPAQCDPVPDCPSTAPGLASSC